MQDGSNNAYQTGTEMRSKFYEIRDLFSSHRKRPLLSDSVEKSHKKKIRLFAPLSKILDDPNLNTRDSFGRESFFENKTGSDPLEISTGSLSKIKTVMTKSQVKNSAKICKKCKLNLLKRNSEEIFVESRMNWSTDFPILGSQEQSHNPVFAHFSRVKLLILKPKSLVAMRMLEVNLALALSNSKSKLFQNLEKTLIKFLVNEEVTFNEMKKMSDLEQRLFLFFLNKKRGHKLDQIDQDLADALSEHWVPKRFEENLRFILNKAFKFLTGMFNVRLLYQLEKQMHAHLRKLSWKSRFEYAFYGYYFQEAAQIQKKPIESFFHPKVSKYPRQPNKGLIPKTISQHYLNLLCSSDLFRRDLSLYVRKCLLREAKHNIVFKVKKLCCTWEKLLTEKGPQGLTEYVHRQFTLNPKCKTPWGIQEVCIASQSILKIVNSQANGK